VPSISYIYEINFIKKKSSTSLFYAVVASLRELNVNKKLHSYKTKVFKLLPINQPGSVTAKKGVKKDVIKGLKQLFGISVTLTRHDNIKMDYQRTVCEDMGWIHLA